MDTAPPAIAVLFDRTWIYVLAALLLVVEAAWPQRPEAGMPQRRWGLHAVLFACSSALGWLLAGGTAMLGDLFHSGQRSPWVGWWHLALVALVLDHTSYWLHRVKHRTPLLWSWHRLHHADTSLDVSTTVRHHPLDALSSGLVIAGLFNADNLIA